MCNRRIFTSTSFLIPLRSRRRPLHCLTSLFHSFDSEKVEFCKSSPSSSKLKIVESRRHRASTSHASSAHIYNDLAEDDRNSRFLLSGNRIHEVRFLLHAKLVYPRFFSDALATERSESLPPPASVLADSAARNSLVEPPPSSDSSIILWTLSRPVRETPRRRLDAVAAGIISSRRTQSPIRPRSFIAVLAFARGRGATGSCATGLRSTRRWERRM